MIDGDEDQSEKEDDEAQIRMHFGSTRFNLANSDLKAFLMRNNLAQFIPLLSNPALIGKSVLDLQNLTDDSIRQFCMIGDFGDNDRPQDWQIEEFIQALRFNS